MYYILENVKLGKFILIYNLKCKLGLKASLENFILFIFHKKLKLY